MDLSGICACRTLDRFGRSTGFRIERLAFADVAVGYVDPELAVRVGNILVLVFHCSSSLSRFSIWLIRSRVLAHAAHRLNGELANRSRRWRGASSYDCMFFHPSSLR